MAKITSHGEAQSGPIVILGGAGFLGTRLTGELVEQGRSVIVGDLKPSPAFPELWKSCDVRSSESLQELMGNAAAIVNLAAEHRDDVLPVSRYYETNVAGAAHVCQAARKAGVSKILFTSSVAVYGFHPHAVGEVGPFVPFNHYGKTKLEAESVYRAWAEEDPSRTLVIIRPAVIFGEGNRGNVYNLLQQIASGKFLMVGSGSNIKSMAYVGNVAAFLIHTLALGPGVHIFNYADGPDMDTRALVGHIWRYLGRSGNPRRVPRSLARIGGYTLDGISRLTGKTFPVSAIRIRKFCETTQFNADRVRESGFEPPYLLTEALNRTIRFELESKMPPLSLDPSVPDIPRVLNSPRERQGS